MVRAAPTGRRALLPQLNTAKVIQKTTSKPSTKKPTRAVKAAELPRHESSIVSEALRDCGVYLDGRRLPGTYDHFTGLAEVRRLGEGFTWLSLSRPNATQMDAIAELYGLDELTVEDALTSRQRPKVEVHDDHIVFVLRSVHYSPEGLADDENEIIRSGQLMIVIGADYVITIRLGMPKMDMVRISERVENNTDAVDHRPGRSALKSPITWSTHICVLPMSWKTGSRPWRMRSSSPPLRPKSKMSTSSSARFWKCGMQSSR